MPLHLLSSDSPACFKAVSRIFQPEEVAVIQNGYSVAVESNVAEEWFKREEGVSFNPRPARLIQLMIEAEPSIVSCETILTGLSVFPRYDEQQQEAVSAALEQEPHVPDSIKAAYCLDWLRHVHLILRSPQINRPKEMYETVHTFVCTMAQSLLTRTAVTVTSLFHSKLQASYSRWK